MQYENNLRKNVLRKKNNNKIWFSKIWSSYNQGRLIFRSIRYIRCFRSKAKQSRAKHIHIYILYIVSYFS